METPTIKEYILGAIYGVEKIFLKPISGRRIIALHDIPNASAFREKMIWLKNNYAITNLTDITTNHYGTDNSVAITFDDGYADFYSTALPILKELRVPATLFVPSGFIGLSKHDAQKFIRNNLKRTRKNLAPLTLKQLQEIAQEPLIDIGGHTTHHIDLGRPIPREELYEEIVHDKEKIEQWIGKKIVWFAYPFGAPRNISSTAQKILFDINYKAAFTITPGRITREDNFFFLKRYSLESDKPLWLWKARLFD